VDGVPAGRGQAWSDAQIAAKVPAHAVRTELLGASDGDGVSWALATELLERWDVGPDVQSLLTAEVVSHVNARRTSPGAHRRDLLIDVVAEVGLDGSWSPDEEELREMAVEVLDLAVGRARRALAALAQPEGRRAQRNARALAADASARLVGLLLARRHQDGEAPDLGLVREELVCRSAVERAVVERQGTWGRGSSSEREAIDMAWIRAAQDLAIPYLEIEDRHDEEEPAQLAKAIAGLQPRCLELVRLGGGAPEGLLVAHLRFTTHRCSDKVKDEMSKVRRRDLHIELHAPLTGGDAVPFEHLLAVEDRPAEVHPDWDLPLADEGTSEDVRDVRRLVELGQATVADLTDWLLTYYPSWSEGGPSEHDIFWSLSRAIRPHSVVWPGYRTHSDRQRGVVNRLRKSARLGPEVGPLPAVPPT
jgi:hypothetical protein